METSVPRAVARWPGSATPERKGPLDRQRKAATAQVVGGDCNRLSKAGKLVGESDLQNEAPITDRERQLVAACLGDLMNQILSEPK
jgi:hypothetical protein